MGQQQGVRVVARRSRRCRQRSSACGSSAASCTRAKRARGRVRAQARRRQLRPASGDVRSRRCGAAAHGRDRDARTRRRPARSRRSWRCRRAPQPATSRCWPNAGGDVGGQRRARRCRRRHGALGRDAARRVRRRTDVPLIVVAAQRRRRPRANLPVAVRVVRTPHIAAARRVATTCRAGGRRSSSISTRAHRRGRERAHRDAGPSDGLASTYGVTASTSSAPRATHPHRVPDGRVGARDRTGRTALIDPGQTAGIRRARLRCRRRPAGRRALASTSRCSTARRSKSRRSVLDARGPRDARRSATRRSARISRSRAPRSTGRRALDANSRDASRRARSARRRASERRRRSRRTRPHALQARRPRRRQRHPRRRGRRCAGHARGRAGVRSARGRRRRWPGERRRSTLHDALGDVRVGVAFVRDGALYTASVRVAIDGPGHPRLTNARADRARYAPGGTRDDHASTTASCATDATVVVRVTDGRVSAGSRPSTTRRRCSRPAARRRRTRLERPELARVGRAGALEGDRHLRLRAAAGRARAKCPPLGAAAPRALFWSVDRERVGSDGARRCRCPPSAGATSCRS